MQNLIFFRIHVIWSPIWFPRPGAHQGQYFGPISFCDQWLVPSLDKNFVEYCWDCWDGISELSHWYTQLLLMRRLYIQTPYVLSICFDFNLKFKPCVFLSCDPISDDQMIIRHFLLSISRMIIFNCEKQ